MRVAESWNPFSRFLLSRPQAREAVAREAAKERTVLLLAASYCWLSRGGSPGDDPEQAEFRSALEA